MLDYQELRELNYAEAYKCFIEEQEEHFIEMCFFSELIVHRCEVEDLRNTDIEIPREIFEGGWLILIDGASCSGKTTLAKKLGAKYPESINVVDVDLVCMEWIKRQIEKSPSLERKINILRHQDKLTDQFLLENFEEMVKGASIEGKTTIVVGCFMDIIYRALAGFTLGKYYKRTAFVTIQEGWSDMKYNMKQRELQFEGMGSESQIRQTEEQYVFFENVLNNEPNLLGIGADRSFIVNKKVKY